MAYQSEAALEQQFIEQLNKQEYSTVDIPDYDALVENFKVQFEAFNAPKLDTPITDKEWERIFNLMLGKSVFQSAKNLRDKFVLEREDGTKVYLSFFDQDHTKNIFQVTHQTTVVGKYVNRYDVTILVNGLPLIQVELKRRGIDIREAVNQVMRYKKHSYNGLYHFIQLFIVSNGVDTKYFANSDRDLMYSLAFFWTDFNNIRITNLKDFSISFLARDHIIKMLTRYTILNDTDKILMVMRPYQVYAVEALIRQATLTNRNAYIWHTTGAGKTLTSFKTAQILAANPNIKKVIFLVDRKDLDSQTTEEFNKFEAGSVDVTDRTDILVRQMKDKNRQLIVTTMQKMANAVKRPQYEKVMDAYRDEKVVFIIDECHRSQFGDIKSCCSKPLLRFARSFAVYTAAVNGSHYAMYRLAKELLKGDLIKRNSDAAVEWFARSAEGGNPYAQYMLGKLYLAGKEIPRDEEKAAYWLTQSAEQGNQYAQYLLNHLEENRPPSAMLAVTRLLHHMSWVFRDNSVPKSRPGGIQIDRKRLKKLQEKRMALGHKPDDHEQQWPDLTM